MDGKEIIKILSTIAVILVAFLCFVARKRRTRVVPNTTATNDNTTSSITSVANSTIVVYEVFLSFHGRDTRTSFTDFLYTYMTGASIITFKDNNELRVGEKIGPELLKAIEESKISIPILSKNYASSRWCLLELAQMVECKKLKGQMIYPIFYDVDPANVRNQSGSYEKAFHLHKKKYDKETVQGWREALGTVGELKGLELTKATNGHEGELVKMIVEMVLLELKKNYTHVPKNLVGLDDHIVKMKELLRVGYNGVRIVGIHGMGGLGKTTIAKVVFNELCKCFDSHCFLDNVCENSESPDGLINLQNQLISRIQNREIPKIYEVNLGSDKVRDAVRGRKVLIVLDNVDESDQLDMLMGNQSWYGAQSRIIITTRNTKVLEAIRMTCETCNLHDVYASYEPHLMDSHHSLQLFSRYAFMRDTPLEGYDKLSEEVVSIAAGLPLVLVVFGSNFFVERDKEIWEDDIKMLRDIPHAKVSEKLKISFQRLQNVQKQVFLDIACFFTRSDKTRPCYMWDDCAFYSRSSIRVLVSRSLITVDDDNVLQMHDQLRDLGRQIVREECLERLGEQSRLWREDEALHVLNTRQGTSNVTVLCLPNQGLPNQPFVESNFHNLTNLRYLVMRGYNLNGDFMCLLSNLRWLQWTCSGKFLLTNFNLSNLVILDLSDSKFTEDWEGWSQFKMSKKLKVLNLVRCFQLKTIPDMTVFKSLERLELQNCRSLRTLEGLEQLKSLKHLDASACSSLLTLPSPLRLKMLVFLNLSSCTKLIEIPGLEKLESLQVMKISYCSSLKKLPSLVQLQKLRKLEASKCEGLIELRGLENLIFLEELNLSYCRSLEAVPDLSTLNKLKLLDVSWTYKINIPGLEQLESLENLSVNYHRSVERLPDLSLLTNLKKLLILPCDNLIEFQGQGGLQSLEDLLIYGCRSLRRLWNLSCFTKLKTINISSCHELIEIQGLDELESLDNMRVADCILIERLPDLSKLKSLKELFVSSMESLNAIQGLNTMESLEYLYIGDNVPIVKLPDLPNFGILKLVHLSNCCMLLEVDGIGVIESLQSLYISDCDKVIELPDLRRLTLLERLSIRSLGKVTRIPGLEKLNSLEWLDIHGCTSIETLPDLSVLSKLTELVVSHCVKLCEICGLENLKFLTRLRITGCEALQNLPDLPDTKIETGYGTASIGPDTTFNFKRKILSTAKLEGWINKIKGVITGQKRDTSSDSSQITSQPFTLLRFAEELSNARRLGTLKQYLVGKIK